MARWRGIGASYPSSGPRSSPPWPTWTRGNFATNIQGGAKFGYLLLWVIVASNMMAMLVQLLSAKLGIATGRNLAEVCRDEFSRPVVWGMWVAAELVAMATDLAEFVGAAVGFNLLFGIPLFPAALLTGVATFLILALQNFGFRPLEWMITLMVGIIGASYLVETLLERPDWGALPRGAVSPRFDGTESVLLAVGILGATVMPHVIFLHSSLTQHRIRPTSPREAERLYRFQFLDVALGMGVAGLINAAMLIMAAATFHAHGLTDVASLEEAYRTLTPLLGRLAGLAFAIALIVAGLASATVGTMAGQMIMQGFLHFKIPIWVRRAVTMIPALVVIGAGLDPTRTLVLSQVFLSFGIPFALIPLVIFTRNRAIMGGLVNHRITTAAAVAVSLVILFLNAYLLVDVFFGSAR